MKTFLLLLICTLLPLFSSCKKTSQTEEKNAPSNVDHYTCAMHPSVISHDPEGKCPICSMDLIPVMKLGGTEMKPKSDLDSSGSVMRVFTVPVERQQQIGVTYETVAIRPLQRTVRTVGIVAPNKQLHYEFVSRVEGYVEKLFVTSPGELVEKDQPLLSIYSPELATAEREFISLLDTSDNARLLQESRRRLEQWNLMPAQIDALQKTRTPSNSLTLLSPFRGVVEAVPVDIGRKVVPSDHLVDVVDLSNVWVWVEFYESEIPYLAKGQEIVFSSVSLPGRKFSGKIVLIDPFVDETLRTERVRVDLENADLALRPGMYLDADLTLRNGEGLAVPFSAIIPTGRRNLVFVNRGEGKLEPRTVELGQRYDGFYEVKSGLSEGESVVTSANFLIDAESKLQGAVKNFEPISTPATTEETP